MPRHSMKRVSKKDSPLYRDTRLFNHLTIVTFLSTWKEESR